MESDDCAMRKIESLFQTTSLRNSTITIEERRSYTFFQYPLRSSKPEYAREKNSEGILHSFFSRYCVERRNMNVLSYVGGFSGVVSVV